MSEPDGGQSNARDQRQMARAERLAAELRANLQRRKAQSRGRSEQAPAVVPAEKEPRRE